MVQQFVVNEGCLCEVIENECFVVLCYEVGVILWVDWL